MNKRDDTLRAYLLAVLGITSVLLLAGLAAWTSAGPVVSLAIPAIVTITTVATRTGRRR
jgi:hypothetical protein